ncbi:hypothetical protein UPYG_G00081280 [Umbra pygmaea]|uniref:Uncharacterized protein n=1 Tax=Umbra pygmaea TaxID=75934 RepID=A0ABD0XDR4_UMBPY
MQEVTSHNINILIVVSTFSPRDAIFGHTEFLPWETTSETSFKSKVYPPTLLDNRGVSHLLRPVEKLSSMSYCSCCSLLLAKIAKLEARLQTQLPEKENPSVANDKNASEPPGSVDSSSYSPALSLQPDNFLMVAGKGRRLPARLVSNSIPPTDTFNRFSPLDSDSGPESSLLGIERQTHLSRTDDKMKSLVISDSITRNIRLKNQPAIIHNLRLVLTKSKTGKAREYRDIVIHVGTNGIRMN